MIRRHKSVFNKNIDKKLPLILLASMLIVSGITAYLFQRSAEQVVAQRFMRITESAASAIQNSLYHYMSSLRQVSALFIASEKVTPEEFSNYALSLRPEGELAGIGALGFANFIRASDLQARVTRFQDLQDITIPLLGEDLMASLNVQTAMLESAASGAMRISPADGLINQNGELRSGFILFNPIYDSRETPSSESERMNSLRGFVFGIFSHEMLFSQILSSKNFFQGAIGVDIYTREAEGLELTYTTAHGQVDPNHKPSRRDLTSFSLAGKEWVLNVYTMPIVEAAYRPRIGYYIFVTSTLLSFLFFWAARRLFKAKEAVEQSESQMAKVAQQNSLSAQIGETLGRSLSSNACMDLLTQFYADHFSPVAILMYGGEEEGEERKVIVKTSSNFKSREQGEELALSSKARVLANELAIYEKAREREGRIYEDNLDDPDFKSALAIPLSLRGNLYGVIALLGDASSESLEDKAAFIEHLSQTAMIFVENAHLYEEAELANRLKDEFLATVSHELRTPLNVIYGHSQLLLESDLNEDAKDQIQSIYNSAKAQSIIIEDLLDIAAIISGKINFSPRPVKVISAIDTALESVKLEAQRRGVELIIEDPHQCIVMGVKTRLVQVFWNLLSNAIKFTPEGGKVAVTSEVQDQNCVVKVIDTGRGIEPEFLPHIFEKFRQEEKVSTRARGGLGLGLSIVSHLVSLHGGTIKAESEGKNKGTTFTVSLPVFSLSAHKGPKGKKHKQEKIEKRDLQELKVLAVDDEPESLNLVARILRSHKANVVTASGGKEALKKLKTERPDVIISDIAMPEMDGYELIKEIRRHEKGQGTHTPAIALTAFAQEEAKKRAISSGYEAYLSKPVNKDKLLATVEQAML